MTIGQSMEAIAPMTTAVTYCGEERSPFAENEGEPRDGRADGAADDVLKHRSLLPDHLADGHTVPRSCTERRVTSVRPSILQTA